MKLLSMFLSRFRSPKKKTLADYQQELLIKAGREQFNKLKEKGLQIPIVLL